MVKQKLASTIMHLQQTKRGSRATGGPQYYFHQVPEHIRDFLRRKGAVEVALMTPYGATKSHYKALGAEHKLDRRGRAVPGRVGHDRIQQGEASESIGEAIRSWYDLPRGDFERIDVEGHIGEAVLYLAPLRCKYAGTGTTRALPRIDRPLTFIRDQISPLWREQLTKVNREQPGIISWIADQICRVIRDHLPATRAQNVLEPDLLRACGALTHLGVALGPYVGVGYDCSTEFRFLKYPPYTVPVEIKKNSRDFSYQEHKYGKTELSRAVVLCAVHGHPQLLSADIDVIELDALCNRARNLVAGPDK